LEILIGLIQFTLFLMGKFNSKVELPLGTHCVRLSRVRCNYLPHKPLYSGTQKSNVINTGTHHGTQSSEPLSLRFIL